MYNIGHWCINVKYNYNGGHALVRNIVNQISHVSYYDEY